jgi:hypothetical protein
MHFIKERGKKLLPVGNTGECVCMYYSKYEKKCEIIIWLVTDIIKRA